MSVICDIFSIEYTNRPACLNLSLLLWKNVQQHQPSGQETLAHAFVENPISGGALHLDLQSPPVLPVTSTRGNLQKNNSSVSTGADRQTQRLSLHCTFLFEASRFDLLQNGAWMNLAAILCRPRLVPFSGPRELLCASASLPACLLSNPAPAFNSCASEKPIIFTSSRLENVIMRGALYRQLTMQTYRVKTRAVCKTEMSGLARLISRLLESKNAVVISGIITVRMQPINLIQTSTCSASRLAGGERLL